jgi:hypothetical protein
MTDIATFRRAVRERFDYAGFVNLSQLFDPSMAAKLRGYIAQKLADPTDVRPTDSIDQAQIGTIKHDIFRRFPQVYQSLFFEAPLTQHLQILLGDDFVLIPETGIHRNSFGGWHKDVDSQQRDGLTFHWEDGFEVITVGCYFQENSPRYGGGLDVIPGSHKIRTSDYPRSFAGTPVPSNPGDVLFFHHMLDHKASWPVEPLDEAHAKYSAFFCASRNNEHARNYMTYIRQRPVYSWLIDYRYPDDLIAHAAQRGYQLAL